MNYANGSKIELDDWVCIQISPQERLYGQYKIINQGVVIENGTQRPNQIPVVVLLSGQMCDLNNLPPETKIFQVINAEITEL